MALTRLDNLYSSKTGKYLYVSPDDFNATDELDNRGNSPLRPFKTIQRAFIEVARYSYLPGKDNDRFDQFSIMLMPGDHYIDNRPGLVDFDEQGRQRYYDAQNLITANRQEIIDRAYGEIAIQYNEVSWGNNWVVPGDDVVQDKNRYFDAYRLIQKNRTFIQDKALAEVAIQYPDFYFPGDPTTNANYRFADSYRLIQQNRTEIVDTAWNQTVAAYPAAASTQTKCKRDLGYFVDAISLDVFTRGNRYAREFALQYFNNGSPISNGLVGEETQSVFAFDKAKDLMKSALTNQLTIKDLTITADPLTGSNTNSNSCANVRTAVDTLVGIVTTAITNGSIAGLPNPVNDGTFLTGEAFCRRDIGYFIDAISLDVLLGAGNRYTRKFLQNYFNASGTSWITQGLQGEVTQSQVAFNKARDMMKAAVTNQLYYKDYTITPDSATGSNIDPLSCANVRTSIDNLASLVSSIITEGNLTNLPPETVATVNPGEEICKRDLGYIIDAVASDLANGGNANIIASTKSYFTKAGVPISNGLVGETAQSVVAFNAARDMMKKAVTNQLYSKDLTLSTGPASYDEGGTIISYGPSGNAATCTDVQTNIDTLIAILTETITAGNLNELADIQVTGTIPVFNYSKALEEWQDNSVLDLSNPDNVLYKFNASTGGAIVPRGCSLIGYDLRRTIVRPLYVPDPADGTQGRTSIFNLTGGCYIWQFTIKDGDLSSNSPLFDAVDNVGKVYFQKGNVSQLAVPEYSHHKICIMEYAENEELDRYYQKVARAFALFQPTIDDGDFEPLPQENRIVGPLSDTRSIVNIKLVANENPEKTTVRVTTKIAHGYFKDQYIAIIDNGLNDLLNGTFKVTGTNIGGNPKVFEYVINSTTAILGLDITTDGYSTGTTPSLSINARSQAEIDSVESASPYVFNCSIRSTWGICGMWADGAKSTGFRSMVVAQYTGVSLQKDDRAFIRYDEFTNTWNQASLTDAFATVPYHTKGDAYWKDDWRNFHIRASNDAFIQCVSVFAVGFHDHFLMESGGDMSITNSNSNFGNTSLHAVGFKGFAFNQDKGGYITDIIPVKQIDDSAFNENTLKYYSIALQPTKLDSNNTKLYYGADNASDAFTKPTTTIEGYRLGAKNDEKIYLKLKSTTGATDEYNCTLEPSGFKRYTVSLDTLNPDGIAIDNLAQDAANRVEDNKLFIQQEAYGYITAKYPDLLTNTNITISKCQRDIGYFVDAVVQDLRLGGNINTIQAAEGYYVGGQLAYIPNELNETIEALDYVKNLCVSAMRNFDYLIRNCATTVGSAIIDIGDTSGILIGMKVTQYAFNTTNFTNGRLNAGAVAVSSNPAIPSNVYVKRIVDATKIEIGTQGSKLNTGTAVNALTTTSGGTYLYFELPKTGSLTDSDNNLQGVWAAQFATKDPSIIQDTSSWTGTDKGYPECNNIETTIQAYFSNVNLILNQGLTPLSGRYIDAANLITSNKQLIAEVAVNRMLTQYPGFSVPGGNQNCIDDVLQVIDALTFNIKYGSNSKIYEAALIYATQPSLLLGERDQSAYVYNQVALMAIQAMRNETITITGSSLTQYKDLTVIVDPSNPTCANIASTINTLMGIIIQSIGTEASPGNLTGVTKTTPQFTNITRVEPTLDTANLATRATIFTVNTGGGTSNPHNFETGTPVRLVPRAKDGTDPDKRVIRLPRGFDTNTIYYVIAPGRGTYPEDYSDFTKYPNIFGSTSSTKLMLASTKENAASGIYIYSSETDAVDPNVEIELQQYTLDSTYDLHQYTCNFENQITDEIKTDVPHIFDVPGNNNQVQKIFFRTFGDPNDSELPQITVNGVSQPVSTTQYYYARYVSSKSFSVHTSAAEALAGTPRVTFTSGYGKNFYVFADKRVSPVRFDVAAQTVDTTTNIATTGLWYINVKDETTEQYNIIRRLHELGSTLKDERSKNTFYRRLTDDRSASDRIYRLRYVIPDYADGVRDPLRGFVIKARTDETRKLLPQRIVLKKVASGSPNIAYFETQIPNPTGGTITQQLGLTASELNVNFDYDPYKLSQTKQITSDKTSSKVAFTIQSARKVNVSGTNLLELTVFDHTITNDALKNDKFTTVKITAPQGGTFRINSSTTTDLSRITWSGYSVGGGWLQGYFNVQETGEHYLIIKNIDDNKNINYNSLVNTRFSQPVLDLNGNPVFDGNGNPVLIYADLLAKENSVGSSNNSLSKSAKKDYLYSNKDANVLTVTPGDIIEDDDSVQYRVISVEDVGEIEDSFYIFDINEIQRRIPNQQQGIYYLTCVKGNISPYPTGPGVGENFRNYRFSQPISQLYPLNYKNDPLWFQIEQDGTRNTAIKDAPATVCAANNYVHGLVTTNDSKNSETKEVIFDLVENPALSRYEYIDTPIEAQEGNAVSGSEDRKIAICGDSPYPTEGKLYVELRRPSIARSGNHTFEYLGFGPGNYSTGFPLRQEVVLSDIQDFYAQSKKEDGGIVFYTGLNSNGDLYIGNRKINAITGEETYLERAVLTDSADETGDIGGLVTTFELPVVFEKDITVDGNANFNNPVTINVEANEPNALTVVSNVSSTAGDDLSLDSQSFDLSTIPSGGDIVLHKNQLWAGVLNLNPRGNTLLSGQDYSIRTHADQTNGNTPSNHTPNQELSTLGLSVQFGLSSPKPGDVLLKGKEVGSTGSLGWIYSNYYASITSSVFTVTAIGGTSVRFDLQPGVLTTDASVNVVVGSVLRIAGLTGRFTNVNGIRTVTAKTSTSFTVICPFVITTSPNDPTVVTGSTIEISRNAWKETGILGGEALRTNTDNWGDFRLGINTLARAQHGSGGDQVNGFVSSAVKPRANLDIVGTVFISGKTLSTSPNNFIANTALSARTFNSEDNALLIGGDSASPNSAATIRVMTTNSGRFGINTTNNGTSSTALDRTLVVVGNARITQDTKLQANLEVNGGTLSTTSTFFNLLPTNAASVNAFDNATSLNIASVTTLAQTINFGNIAATSTINLGAFSQTGTLNIHSAGTSSIVNIGTSDNTSATSTSVVRIGGGYAKNSNSLVNGSILKVYNRYAEFDGDLSFGKGLASSTGIARIQSNAAQVDFLTITTSKANIATAAATVNIGALGGTTTIQNSLLVLANTQMNGDTTLAGGLNSGQFQLRRGSFGVSTQTHTAGNNTTNFNIDLLKRQVINKTIDTEGLAAYGNTTWRVDPSNPEVYYLPLGETATSLEYEVGAYLLIDRSTVVTGQNTVLSPVGEQYSELVEIVEITNINNVSGPPSLRLKVKRARNQLTSSGGMVTDGTAPSGYKFLRHDHPDNAILVRYNLSRNVSYLTTTLSAPVNGTLQNATTGTFSGTVTIGDIFRLSSNAEGYLGELTYVNGVTETSIQRFVVNDGGSPATELFTVESTTGNTNIYGTTTVYKNLTLSGSTSTNVDRLIVTDGTTGANNAKFIVESANGDTFLQGNLNVGGQLFDKFVVTGSTGNTLMKGGNLTITASDGTTNRLTLQNSTGNLTISGTLTANGTGESVFGGDVKLTGGDLTVAKLVTNGGVTTETNIFKVNNSGAIDFAGQTGFFSPTGARKWVYAGGGVEIIEAVSNYNYFVAPSSNTVIKLPLTPSTGDMIRVVDVGGLLTYNTSLKFRAPTGIKIQGDSTNSGGSPDPGSTYNGGELIVQTPNAALGLIYIGATNYDGTATGAPTTQQGWWLMEI